MSEPIDLTLLAKAIKWWNKEMRVPSPSPSQSIIVLGSAANQVLEADQIWKCIKHNCDMNVILTQHQPVFRHAEEYCAIEAEWGSLDPKNCEIVRGVFIPVKEA